MPRDNHPRERQARKLARKKPSQPRFDRVLIVTEGAKTEPIYFEDIRKQKRIATAHVEVLHSAYGTQPGQIIDYAEAHFAKTKAFERVYAVFDRDSHQTYANALARAQQLDNAFKNDEGNRVRFFAVPTVPCFELWLLLHFQDVLAFADRHEVIRKLKGHYPQYDKGMAGAYAATEAKLDAATRRARHLRTMFTAAGGADPYTDVDELVEFLRAIRP
jgi:RloB-like protein